MGRRRGSRNADYADKRRELADRVAGHLAESDVAKPCLGSCARAAGVSVPTLKHYFGDHQGVLSAALSQLGQAGVEHLQVIETPMGPVRESLIAALRYFLQGWGDGLGAIVESGLAMGTDDRALGPCFLRDVLEPMILALERRLACHVDRGELRALDTRAAALALFSPMLVGALHQHSLGGASTRPLDMQAFVPLHVDGFLRGYAATEP